MISNNFLVRCVFDCMYSVHEHGTSFHTFVFFSFSLIHFFIVMYRFFISLIKFIPKYFILFDTTANSRWIFFFRISTLIVHHLCIAMQMTFVCRFCILQFCFLNLYILTVFGGAFRIFYIYGIKWKCSLLSHLRLFETMWTVACQVPLFTGFSRQEHWSGYPFLSPVDPPNLGIEPRSLKLQAHSLRSEPPGKPIYSIMSSANIDNSINTSFFLI